MRNAKLLVIFVSSLFSTFAFGQTMSRVVFHLNTPSNISAGATHIGFDLIDTSVGKNLTPTDLNVTHTKELHLIAYDPSLQEFQHVHPDFDGQSWSVDLNFAVDGNYFVWAQGELSSGSVDFNALTRIDVSGGQPALPAPNLTDARTGSDGLSVATLSSDSLHVGQMAMLMLTFARSDGTSAQITPYLGAFAHVIATPEDGSTLTHVHPMDGSAPNEGMLHLEFPTAGPYRLWVQFIDGGVIRTIALSVIVGN